MKKIWKYQFGIVEEETFSMPVGAKIVFVSMQKNHITMWALMDIFDVAVTERTFIIRGTGHDIEDGLEYVGSTMDHPFVWHVFEKIKKVV